jgi:iron complex outermembrane recepter protein
MHQGTTRLALRAAMTALFLAASAAPSALLAQTPDAQAPPAATPPAAEPAAPEEKGGIEEIIVTSRKREELAQDVPVAITALSKELEIASIRDLRDLNGYAPNVRIDEDTSRANGSNISMRGISPAGGRTDDNSLDQPIGVMIDGIYLGTTSGQVLENFDIDRVEILRGPQGTLFGKNTVGGVVHVVRSRPTGEWGARFKYTGGSFDQQEFRAVVNAPIVPEKLAMKGFYTKLSSDGYIDNTFADTRMPKKDYQNYGAAWLVTPFEGFEALLTIEKFDDDSQGGGSLTNYNLAAGVASPPPPGSGEPDFSAGFRSCSTVPGDFALGIPYGHNSGALPPAVDPTQTIFNSGVPCRTSLKRPKTISTDTTNPGKFDVHAYTLDMSYELNENLRAVSVFGYRDMTEDRLLDFDGTEANYITIDRDNDYDQLSEEIRLEGNWERVHAVAGYYYWNSEFTQDWVTGGTFWTNVLAEGGVDLVNNQWLNGAPLPPPVFLCQIGAFGALACDSGINGLTTGLGANFEQVLFETQETTSHAVFGSVDWEFVENWTLTGGLRWTTEKKDFRAGQSYLTSADRSHLRNFPAYADLDNEWDDISPKATLAWEAADDILFYVTYAEGFHSGGFFGVNQNVSDFERDQYDPEYSKSGELGAKMQLFDNRVQLNATYFYNSFEDKQESSVQFDPTTNTVATIFSNVADAIYQGIEIEALWVPIDPLSLFLSFGWLDAEYKNFETDLNPSNVDTPATCQPPKQFVPPSSCIEDASHLEPRNAPQFTVGVGGTFTYEIGPGEAQFSTKYSWVDEMEGDLVNLEFGKIEPRQDLLISAGYTYKNLSVMFFARNLTDEQAEVAFPIYPLFSAGTLFPYPRSYGVEVSLDFGE